MQQDDFDFLSDKLKARQKNGLLRTLPSKDSHESDFYSNDFLGLARKTYPLSEIPSGSSGSRLISGNYSEIEQLESRLAKHYNCEDVLIFNSGYAANLGVLSVLPQKGDVILYDANIHASIKEGFRLSLAKFYSYNHNDLEDLNNKLSKYSSERCWVVTESLFSMHGTICHQEKIKDVCQQHNAFLFVDEAHAVGIMGKNAKGLFDTDKKTIKIITFGKAYGAQGAAVLCSPIVKNYLINFSRPFIYTTGMSPVLAELIDQQHSTLIKADAERAQLYNNIRYFRTKILQKNISISSGDSPIQMWYPKNQNFTLIQEKMKKENISVKAVLPPTVPEGDEAFRVILHSFNTHEEIDRLIGVMVEMNLRK